MPHALIVDDDLSFQLAFAEVVQREGFTIATAPSLKEAREELAKNPPHVLFLDLNLTEPVDFARVKMVLANVARTRELKEEIGSLRGELRKLGRFGPLIGASPLMQKVYDLVGRVARTVHLLSRRSHAAFLPLNCGAVSPTLIESELFGHERGSFTGADRVHKGFFERADGGTLFLDEVTETPMELQVKLLRVLETAAVTRVGGAEAINVDVRVVAATNRQPEEAVAAGKLREDLLYRLNVFPIHLPTLWERRDDIELLAEHFLGLLNKQEGTSKEFTRAALERLRTHRWPGNVRELRNVVQRAFILAEEDVGIDALPLGVHEAAEGSSLQMKVGTSVAEAERRLILATLEHFEGDKKKAAEILKISLKTLYNRINQYKGGVS